MADTRLGRTLFIANPTSHSGAGAKAAEVVKGLLENNPATSPFEMRLTTAQGDAETWASESDDFDTLIVLGGDGVIHEVVCGLMRLPREKRPTLAIVAQGTGNDTARTMGLPLNDAQAAVENLLEGRKRSIDIGMVNGVPFIETLSFGLDAAIALDTTTKRAKGTDEEGEQLFINSAISIVSKESAGNRVRYSFDGGEWGETRSLMFAIQVGPTYGGGFRICPDARPDDGLLDICHNVRKPKVPRLLLLLALARFGKHTRSKALEILQARHIDIEFPDDEPPCQVDGEELRGTRFSIDVVPGALDVLVGKKCAW